MPAQEPPPDCPGTPSLEALRAGTTLWRVHSSGRHPAAMNATARPTADRGGRFDSTDGSYGYLYLGVDEQAAIAETLCRDLPFGGEPRIVPRVLLHGRVLSALSVEPAVWVVRLHGAGLAQVGQDTWLTKCGPEHYLLTRRWAAAVRTWVGAADGFAYRCRHDEDRLAVVLFSEPGVVTHPSLAATDDRLELDSPSGRVLVRAVLARHNAALAR